MRTVTNYNYLLLMTSALGNAKLQCANALGSKEKSQSERRRKRSQNSDSDKASGEWNDYNLCFC